MTCGPGSASGSGNRRRARRRPTPMTPFCLANWVISSSTTASRRTGSRAASGVAVLAEAAADGVRDRVHREAGAARDTDDVLGERRMADRGWVSASGPARTTTIGTCARSASPDASTSVARGGLRARTRARAASSSADRRAPRSRRRRGPARAAARLPAPAAPATASGLSSLAERPELADEPRARSVGASGSFAISRGAAGRARGSPAARPIATCSRPATSRRR